MITIFSAGINVLGYESINITGKHAIDEILGSYSKPDILIVALSCALLRKQFITVAQKKSLDCVILLRDIIEDSYFTIENFDFASLKLSQRQLKRIILNKGNKNSQKFTKRESEILPLFHLKNPTIAKKFEISQKTASGYRISIQKKLRMKTKNKLAALRLSEAISVMHS